MDSLKTKPHSRHSIPWSVGISEAQNFPLRSEGFELHKSPPNTQILHRRDKPPKHLSMKISREHVQKIYITVRKEKNPFLKSSYADSFNKETSSKITRSKTIQTMSEGEPLSNLGAHVRQAGGSWRLRHCQQPLLLVCSVVLIPTLTDGILESCLQNDNAKECALLRAPHKSMPLLGITADQVITPSTSLLSTAVAASWAAGHSHPPACLKHLWPHHNRRAHTAHMGDTPGAPVGWGDFVSGHYRVSPNRASPLRPGDIAKISDTWK